MSLQKSVVPISFAGGVDTKTDPKQVMTGKLLKLFNGVFQKGKEILKRYGTVSLSQSIIGGGTISSGICLSSYQNEIVLLDGTSLYSYSPSEAAWATKGFVQPVILSTNNIVRSTNTQTLQDSAFHAATNLVINVWFDSQNGLCYSIFDNSTQVSLVTSQTLTNTGYYPKVLILGAYFIVIYYNTSTTHLEYFAINTATPTAVSASTLIANDIYATGPAYDATVANNRIYIFYNNTTTGANYTGIYLNTSLALSSKSVFTNGTRIYVMSVVADGPGNLWVTFGTSTTVSCAVYNSAFGVVTGTVLIETIKAALITGVVTGTVITLYYEIPVPSLTFAGSYIKTATMTIGGSASATSVFIRSLGLTSKAFAYNGVNYLVASYNGQSPFNASTEPTYFLLNGTANVIARIAGQNAGPYASNNSNLLTEVINFGSGLYGFSYLIQDNITLVAGTPYFKTGVSSATINFVVSRAPLKFVLANELHTGGGILSMYDSANVVEHGFHLYPENPIPTIAYTGGGIGQGTSSATTFSLQYSVVFEWADNQGQIHRSAPSVPVSLQFLPNVNTYTFAANTTTNSNLLLSATPTAGLFVGQVISGAGIQAGTTITQINGSNITMSSLATATGTAVSIATKDTYTVTVSVPTLRVTAKQNVSLAVYRTTANGTVFYRASSVTNLIYNNKTVDYVSFTDTTPDAVLIGNEQLYTNSGEVENYPVPPSTLSTTFKSRSIIVPSENPYSWWYSKQVIPGSPVEYSAFFVQNIDSRGGPITAIGVLDEKLIFFKTNAIFYVVGSGPAANGSANDFSEAQMISSDCGCKYPKSLAITSDGLMFESSKGLYLLDRSLNVQYIGQEVDDYLVNNDITCTSISPMFNQARFPLDQNSSQVLVYDYNFRQWSVFTGINAIDTTVINDLVSYLTPSGKVTQENTSVYTDDGAFVQLSLTTSWMSFAGIQGFQRIRRILILGTYGSPHTLQVNVAVDFASSFNQNVSIPVLSAPSNYQYRVPMQIQKCETMQFQIQDSQSSSFGQGMSLSAISLEVGIKQGADKLPAGQTYG